MVWSACLALALVCLTQVIPWLPVLLPELAAAGALLVLFLWGPRYGLVVLPVIWSLLHAQWVIDDRLVPALVGQDILLHGTVCEFPDSDPGVHRFVLAPDSTALPGLPQRIFLSWYDAVDAPKGGQSWALKVRLKRPRGLSNPGAFDFEKWALARQIGATGYVRESALNRQTVADVRACPLMRMRQHIAMRMEAALAESPAAGHLLAVSVGMRNNLTDVQWGLLRRTGTVHLMAISGLHIGLVAALLLFAGRQFGRLILRAGIQCAPLFVARWWAVAGAVAYSALAGFALPTVRALVMVLVVMALATVRRNIPGEQTLSAALFVVLLIEPSATAASGFWLSFYAVTLLLFSGIELPGFRLGCQTRLVRRRGKIRQMFRAQSVLSIGLAPLGILFFGQVPVLGLAGNLLVVPIFALFIVPFSLLGMLLLLLWPPLGAAVLVPVSLVMEWIVLLLEWFDRLPFSVWQPPAARPAWVAVAVLATLILIWPRPFPGRILAAMLLIPLAGGSSAHPPPILRVVVMDVGQGLAVLVQTAKHALVYDTGPAFNNRDAGQTVVLPVLRHFGIQKLDALVISHADNDHIGGATSVLAAFPEAALIAPQPLLSPSANYRTCAAGIEWLWDAVSFSILHPERPGGAQRWSKNDRSCVLLVQSQALAVLLPGDIEQRGERHLARNAMIRRVSLVVAPHHGSKTSSSELLVKATAPRFVVFSAGYKNRWGFPKTDVIDRWLQTGACLLSTAESGAIVFEVSETGELRLQWRQRIDGRHIWTEVDRNPNGLPCPGEI
ncbi:MAG: DNA internalization-related competence protein ComEC/Rec2 [Gammaproteobacteria bacterium]|nr:DNA internalization-related competence protein ComEC/Rec2 [Gammaproteobacteria bacterium]